jgi:hypothetical protein
MTTHDNKNVSTILTLESLEKEYENTMILYQQAQTNYNSVLNGVISNTNSSNVVTSNGKRYVLIPSKVFWGNSAIQQKSIQNNYNKIKVPGTFRLRALKIIKKQKESCVCLFKFYGGNCGNVFIF